MKMRTVLYLMFFVLAGVLVAANWELMVRPAEVDLIISRAAVPGILIALFLIGTVLLVDWVFHLSSRSEWRQRRNELAMRNEQLQSELRRVTEERHDSLHRLIEHESTRIRSQLDEMQRQELSARARTDDRPQVPVRARAG